MFKRLYQFAVTTAFLAFAFVHIFNVQVRNLRPNFDYIVITLNPASKFQPNFLAALPSEREIVVISQHNNSIDKKFRGIYRTPIWPIQLEHKRERNVCLLYTSPSPRDLSTSRMPSSA